MNTLTTFASEAAAEGQQDLFTALGINWQLLIVQVVSFLILFVLLKKLVYPALLKAIDERQAAIEASSEAAKEAQVAAEKAEKDTEAQLSKAKKEAADIIEVAHKEATKMIEEAEAKAGKRAEHIVAQAEVRLASDIADARESLRKEMTTLVATATEKVTRQKLDSKADADLIAAALKEAN
jgi:F-type H+-transporting ATPase subunit b